MKGQNGKKEHKDKDLENADDEPPLSSRGSYQKRKPSAGIQQNAKEKDEKPVQVAIYSRVSTNKQVEYGYSLEQQVSLCRERCRLMGWHIRYIFKERGVSGKNTSRPQFQVMLRKAQMGRFDVLIFNRLDRFARSLHDVVAVEQELRSYNVCLYSVQEMIDTTTESGRFVCNLLASVAQLERHLIRQRSRTGMRALAKCHLWPNRLTPLGYDKKDDGKLEINADEKKLVKKIFRMYLKLKSMPQVAFELNKIGAKTKRDNPFTTVAVKRILDNQIYMGVYQVAGIEEQVPEYKILDKGLFEKAKNLRFRAKKIREEMPQERKTGTIARIFNEYLEFLKDEDQTKAVCHGGRIV